MEWIVIPLSAFLAELVDSSLGMGYGTILAPCLLLAGYDASLVVPGLLFSEFVTGMVASASHDRHGNVNFGFYLHPERKISLYQRGKLTRHFQIAMLLLLCSLLGTCASGWFILSYSKEAIALFIGGMITLMGLYVFLKWGKKSEFSWWKLFFLGLFASFNKGCSGGGYGPLLTSGQLICGIEGKAAVAITSFAESGTCAMALSFAYLYQGIPDLSLGWLLLLGAFPASMFSGRIVSRVKMEGLERVVGLLTITLGSLLLWRTIVRMVSV
jgi:uncharacterized membrane protein YfcA